MPPKAVSAPAKKKKKKEKKNPPVKRVLFRPSLPRQAKAVVLLFFFLYMITPVAAAPMTRDLFYRVLGGLYQAWLPCDETAVELTHNIMMNNVLPELFLARHIICYGCLGGGWRWTMDSVWHNMRPIAAFADNLIVRERWINMPLLETDEILQFPVRRTIRIVRESHAAAGLLFLCTICCLIQPAEAMDGGQATAAAPMTRDLFYRVLGGLSGGPHCYM